MKRSTCFALFLSLAAVALLESGCATGDFESSHRDVDRAARQAAAERAPAVPEKDRVLFDYHAAATALRQGHNDQAKEKLDDAIVRIGGIVANSADAKKARSLFSAESTKVFIGEPYERVMAYFYRGILYWRDGQPDNARACFRTGAIIDSDPEQGHYDSDYVLLDYLDGFATTKLAGDGSDALRRAQEHVGDRLHLPPYDPAANVLVFAEFGYGPRKYAAGEFGEQLKFHSTDSPTHSARLILDDGAIIVALPIYDDLSFQATTRGGRVMDHILGNKAVFKTATDVGGDLALVGAVIAHDEAERRKAEGRDGRSADATALGLGVLGLIGKVASAATKPRADTRDWDNLPQRLSFAAVKLPPGEHRGRLEFLDRDGEILAARTQNVAIDVASTERDTVVFLSELKR